jgi:hypothetical protein
LTAPLQFATNPEAAARRKQQRSTAKKEGRKRKNAMFAYVSEPSIARLSSDGGILGIIKADSNDARRFDLRGMFECLHRNKSRIQHSE